MFVLWHFLDGSVGLDALKIQLLFSCRLGSLWRQSKVEKVWSSPQVVIIDLFLSFSHDIIHPFTENSTFQLETGAAAAESTSGLIRPRAMRR